MKIKIVLDGVTRKMPKSEAWNLRSVRAFCTSRWTYLEDCFLLQYVDEDEDLVSVDTEEEFVELLEDNLRNGTSSLKLYIKKDVITGDVFTEDTIKSTSISQRKRPLEDGSQMEVRKKRKIDPAKKQDLNPKPPSRTKPKQISKIKLTSHKPKSVVRKKPKLRSKKKKGASIYHCVAKASNGRWRGALKRKGKYISCGTFDTEIEAAQAVNEKCDELGIPHKNPDLAENPTKMIKEALPKKNCISQENEESQFLSNFIGASAMCDWKGEWLPVDVTEIDPQTNELLVQWRSDRKISRVRLHELREIRQKLDETSESEGADASEDQSADRGGYSTTSESGKSEEEESGMKHGYNLRSHRESQYHGVVWSRRKQKWMCEIKDKNEMRVIDYFDSEFQAAVRYDEHARQLFANNLSAVILNFPTSLPKEQPETVKTKPVKQEPEEGELYSVEKILKQRYNKKTRRKEWLVKWQGFGMKEATWEPQQNLRANVTFDEFRKKSAGKCKWTCKCGLTMTGTPQRIKTEKMKHLNLKKRGCK